MLPHKVAIIGAGAAGCFCAAVLKEMAPELSVTLFEAGPKPMAKLAVTGGGRCNLTNDFQGLKSLSQAYPRGERVMKRALKAFSPEDTIRWFEDAGVPMVLQADHCWFPRSQNALDVVNCLRRAMKDSVLHCNTTVSSICHSEDYACRPGWLVVHSERSRRTSVQESFDAVVVTTGGGSAPFLDGLELEIVPPVPSLFTFNIPDKALNSLMGLVTDAGLGLPGTNFRADGPLLITDWGFSGPASLKLSSYAARHLAQTNYRGKLAVNWLNAPETEVRALLQQFAATQPQKQLSTAHPPLQARLWALLMERASLRPDIRWCELGSKGLNRLCATLCCDTYPLEGKSRFRDEFVTAGGIGLSNINLNTLECKTHPGLYFAGEVLDIDAITGGFNLQAAWSTAHTVAQSLCHPNR